MTPPQRRAVPALIDELVDAMKGLDPTFSVPELDEMEKGLQITAARLRGMRNSAQPINRLPPELLARIFGETQVHLPSFIPNPTMPDGTMLDGHEWMGLLQVCRRWRGVIANQKFLFWDIFKEFPISQSVLHQFT
ncbi:hypothetical protein B0H11DRAFT_1980428 [Mycena galericulata]|nr:hypothetical protein B0H11DRAFT_1980428 [Mycena galericulata]